MEEDDDDFSINASPTPVSASSSWRSQRSRKKETSSKQHIKTESVETRTQCGGFLQANVDFRLCEERLHEADRLDCLRAQQEPVRERVVPASKQFLSLQCLLESQQLPEEAKTEPAATSQLESSPSHIVQAILKDFCSSPTYAEEELPAYDTPPWFRFRKKEIRVYTRRRLPLAINTAIDDEDCLSCSSGLSVQEDFTTQVPITTHCAFDVNSSQRICENLQNLSAFFTQNNANTSIDLPNAAVRPKETQIEAAVDSDSNEDATDILKDIGFFIANTEEYQSLIVDCDIKARINADFTLFGESNSLAALQDTSSKVKQPKIEDTYFSDDWFNVDFKPQVKEINLTHNEMDVTKVEPTTLQALKQENEFGEVSIKKSLKEGQAIDMHEQAGTSNYKPKHIAENPQQAINDCNQLDVKQFSEWQPVAEPEIVEFRTASNKSIAVTEEKLKKAVSLMADIKASYVPTELEVKDTKIAAAVSENEDCDQLDIFAFSEWQPVDMPETCFKSKKKLVEDIKLAAAQEAKNSKTENVDFSNAANRNIIVSKEKQIEALKLRKDLKTNYTHEPKELDFGCMQSTSSTSIGFKTASNKQMKLTEQMRKKAATLMSDLEYGFTNQQVAQNDCKQPNQIIDFRTASNRTVSVTEEMQKAAKDLMSNLETVSLKVENKEQLNNIDFLDGIPLSEWQPMEIPETSNASINNLTAASSSKVNPAIEYINSSIKVTNKIEFRSASNKLMEFTEEMQKRAKTLMADLENVAEMEMETTSVNPFLNKLSLRESKKTESTLKEITKSESFLDTEIGVEPLPSEANEDIAHATPLQPKCLILNNEFETPRCTPETHISLTQLSERSPLDKATKSSIITRRNLLSLNKRRKQKRDAENDNKFADSTPNRACFAPMATATSTPVPSQKVNEKNVDKNSLLLKRARSCSQDSPRVQRAQRERVGKRRSEEALSPICAPTIKTRRLGLSRIRNKSTHDI